MTDIGTRFPGDVGGPRFRGGGGGLGGDTRSSFQPRGGGGNYRGRFPLGEALHYDGKRMRNKTVLRKTVDYNAAMLTYVQNRIFGRDVRDQHAIQADPLYTHQLLPPPALLKTPMNGVCTRFVRQATNKIKCPIFCVCWTPEGRRLITGASSGEFTLWNGLTFNFETILQAHDTSVRAMVWSHNDQWMLTADHQGFLKYWQSNMNNVKVYQGHKDPVRGLSFCPTDSKFASCSDDGTVRIWDFLRCHEEKILRGHGADVKCVDWHPSKSLVASGSKDTQQPLKLWDPRTGTSLATVHAHKHTVMEVKWNRNGNWLLTASRDHLLKLFDVRNMKEELQSFKGHRKEATTIAWHSVHEDLFASGGSDGQIMYWLVGTEKEVGSINEAHETMVWSLAWHPLGHILVSGSNDHTTKFWTRNRPGDRMRDRYNLNTLPPGMSEDMLDFDDVGLSIPGMGGVDTSFLKPPTTEASPATPGTSVTGTETKSAPSKPLGLGGGAGIPGLDFSGIPTGDGHGEEEEAESSGSNHNRGRYAYNKQKHLMHFAKPVPKDFEMAWAGITPEEQEAEANQQRFAGRPPKTGLLGDAPPGAPPQGAPPPPSDLHPPPMFHPDFPPPNTQQPPPQQPPPPQFENGFQNENGFGRGGRGGGGRSRGSWRGQGHRGHGGGSSSGPPRAALLETPPPTPQAPGLLQTPGEAGGPPTINTEYQGVSQQQKRSFDEGPGEGSQQGQGDNTQQSPGERGGHRGGRGGQRGGRGGRGGGFRGRGRGGGRGRGRGGW